MNKKPRMCDVRKYLTSLLVAVAFSAAWAQDTPLPNGVTQHLTNADIKVPGFDVVSVKRSRGDEQTIRLTAELDGYTARNVSLQKLLVVAYGIRPDLISGGPNWIATTGFSVEAKVAGPDVEALRKLSLVQRNAMLKQVLEERFHLRAHIESRMQPIYELIVAKGGPKLHAISTESLSSPNTSSAKDGTMTIGPGEGAGRAVPATTIAGMLGGILQQRVVDKTGLTGKYDFNLKWDPSETGLGAVDGGATDNQVGPSIFTALQEQLGLKVIPAKAPVDALVIDHAELPTEN